MDFYVVDVIPTQAALDSFYLVRDNWNDWFVWRTMRTLVYVDGRGQRTAIGSVKIGRAGMTEESAVTELPFRFERLGDQYFSLGQSENYYETLADLPERVHDEVLECLRDCAYNAGILNQFINEAVMGRSLLRDIAPATVASRYRRLAHCESVLTPYSFRYRMGGQLDHPPEIAFEVQPLSMPPTNIHVLIGRNGVGKTHCFNMLAKAVL